jgi:hypothetical protein
MCDLMLSIEEIRPRTKTILSYLEQFEKFCLGLEYLHPSKFRDINNELSICAVLMIGKRRFHWQNSTRRLIWIGLDEQEHDLGDPDDMNVMRDYPGFHAARTMALGHDLVKETRFINPAKGNGSVCEVILKDGTHAIAPNYRMALRNASLKMHLKTQFNTMSLSRLWNGIWGNA